MSPELAVALLAALVFWFSVGLTYWAISTRLRLGRDRREQAQRERRR